MDRDSIHEEQYKGFTIKIVQDDDSENPRAWDNAGTMVCWHSRYDLGDKQPKERPIEFLCGLLGLDSDNFSQTDETVRLLMEKMEKDYIILPLYLYDHSGITISTSNGYPYNDRWDAGQVGFIYISKKDAVKEWGKKLFTKTVEKDTVKYLRGEVKTYDDYLTGNVYGYEVCDKNDDVIDSVWGFYPDHDDNSGYAYCLGEAKEFVDYEVEERRKKSDAQEQLLTIAQVHN